MACSIDLFAPFLDSLQQNQSDIVGFTIENAPLKYGFSFGSCYTLCGSLGITDVNLDNLTINTDTQSEDPPSLKFSDCGSNPLSAILRVPISGLITMTLRLRAQGKNDLTWPASGSGEINHDAVINGEILFTFPMSNSNIELSNYLVSVNFVTLWTNDAWPDDTNFLFDKIPKEKLLFDWTTQFNDHAQKRFIKKTKKLVLLSDIGYTCTIPSYTPMVCTADMALAGFTTIENCHPCDTCCKCFVQQRCDSGCNACPCINCTKSSWIIGPLIITIYIFFLIILLLWKCYNTQFKYK